MYRVQRLENGMVFAFMFFFFLFSHQLCLLLSKKNIAFIHVYAVLYFDRILWTLALCGLCGLRQ